MYKAPGRPLLLTETAAFTGLIALGSWISIPFIPVPFTLQTLFVLLSGAVMRRYAVLPAALYVMMGILGIPVFHGGSAGLGILLGPTGGYILGFIPGAFVTGLFFERREAMAEGAWTGAGRWGHPALRDVVAHHLDRDLPCHRISHRGASLHSRGYREGICGLADCASVWKG